MSNKPLTEGSVRHAEKSASTLKPVAPPPSAKPKNCCGKGCHTVKKPNTKQSLKKTDCADEPLELKCIHYDAVFAAFVMISVASGIFGLGLGMTLFAIGTSASVGFAVIGLAAMALGAVGSVALWSTLSEGIKVYKKIMKEED